MHCNVLTTEVGLQTRIRMDVRRAQPAGTSGNSNGETLSETGSNTEIAVTRDRFLRHEVDNLRHTVAMDMNVNRQQYVNLELDPDPDLNPNPDLVLELDQRWYESMDLV